MAGIFVLNYYVVLKSVYIQISYIFGFSGLKITMARNPGQYRFTMAQAVIYYRNLVPFLVIVAPLLAFFGQDWSGLALVACRRSGCDMR